MKHPFVNINRKFFDRFDLHQDLKNFYILNFNDIGVNLVQFLNHLNYYDRQLFKLMINLLFGKRFEADFKRKLLDELLNISLPVAFWIDYVKNEKEPKLTDSDISKLKSKYEFTAVSEILWLTKSNNYHITDLLSKEIYYKNFVMFLYHKQPGINEFQTFMDEWKDCESRVFSFYYNADDEFSTLKYDIMSELDKFLPMMWYLISDNFTEILIEDDFNSYLKNTEIKVDWAPIIINLVERIVKVLRGYDEKIFSPLKLKADILLIYTDELDSFEAEENLLFRYYDKLLLLMENDARLFEIILQMLPKLSTPLKNDMTRKVLDIAVGKTDYHNLISKYQNNLKCTIFNNYLYMNEDIYKMLLSALEDGEFKTELSKMYIEKIQFEV